MLNLINLAQPNCVGQTDSNVRIEAGAPVERGSFAREGMLSGSHTTSPVGKTDGTGGCLAGTAEGALRHQALDVFPRSSADASRCSSELTLAVVLVPLHLF